MEKIPVFLKCCCSLKTSLFVLFNATAESVKNVGTFLFLKNVGTHFLQCDLRKKLCQTY